MSKNFQMEETAGPSLTQQRPPAWVVRVTAVVRRVEMVSTASGYLAALFLALVTLLTLFDIAGRNLLRVSVIRGVTELASWAMAAIAWLALSYTMKTDGHVQVRILVDHLPAKARRVLAVFVALMGVALLSFLVYSMWGRLMFILRQGVQGTEVKISLAAIYGFVLAGAVLLLVETLAKLWYAIAPFFGGSAESGLLGSDLQDVRRELRDEDQAVLAEAEAGNRG